MFKPTATFLTPIQDAFTRKDQYAQKQTWNGGGTGFASSQLDPKNNVWYQQSQPTNVPVVVISIGDSTLDSNGYYKVKLLDCLTGYDLGGYESTTVMRLNTFGVPMSQGQTAVGVFNTATSGSIDPADDGFMLLYLAVQGEDIGWIWTPTITASDSPYSAQPYEAITCSLVGGDIVVELPPFGDLPAGIGDVAIMVITDDAMSGIRNVVVQPQSGELINGQTGQWMLEDMGAITEPFGGTSGGHWVFWRTGNDDIQWSASRRLVRPPGP